MMFAYYITFRSITAAQQAVLSLQKSGVSASLIRMPRFASSNGCGYAVTFQERDRKSVEYVFQRDGISYSRVLRIHTNGKTEEVNL